MEQGIFVKKQQSNSMTMFNVFRIVGGDRFVRAMRIAFVTAAVFAFVMAVLPQPPRLPGEPGDKLLHILAFAVLALLATLAFPARRVRTIVAGLAVFGALIEGVQAIPALGRDSELADLVADVAAAALIAWPVRQLMHRWADRRV